MLELEREGGKVGLEIDPDWSGEVGEDTAEELEGE